MGNGPLQNEVDHSVELAAGVNITESSMFVNAFFRNKISYIKSGLLIKVQPWLIVSK